MEDGIKADPFDFDILQELGNIGANNAATAISQLFGKGINVSITKAKVVGIKEIGERTGPPEAIVGAIFVRILRGMAGGLLLILPKSSALSAVDMLAGKPPGETQHLQEMDASAFREFGNIVTGAYLSAIANFLGTKLDQSVPYMSFDMAGAIVDFIAIEIAKFSEHAILVRTEFSAERTKGELFLILDSASAARLLGAAKKKIGK